MFFLITLHSAVVQTFNHVGDYIKARDGNRLLAIPYYKLASPIGDGGYALFSNPNIDIEIAKHMQDNGDFQEAQRLLERIDYRVGSDEQSTLLIVHNLQSYAQYAELNTFYSERLQRNPHWLLIWEDYVGWLKRDGLFAQALASSKQSVKENPQAKRLRMQLALLEMGYGNTANAVALTQGLTEEFAGDPALWMLHARALDRDNQRDTAREAAQKAQQVQKDSYEK